MLDKNLKKKSLHRARIIRGQMDGLIKAIEEEEYCIALITQSRAMQSSLKSLDRMLLENHLQSHVKHMFGDARQEKRAIKELADLYALSKK